MSVETHGRGGLRRGRPGLLICLLLGSLSACSQDDEPARDIVRLESGDVQLPEGSRRHDVHLEGVGAQAELNPATVEARVGDAVAFTAADGITHSVVFLAEHTDSAQVAFLEAAGQMRGPPLLAEGSTWVVTFADAPPGDYAFACALHGGRGVVRVAAAD